MSRLDIIRGLSDDDLILFLRKYKAEKSNCKRCAKNGTRCNPYTGKDCVEGTEEYFRGEGSL